MAIDYAKAYQKFIDEEFCAASVTKWMEANAKDVKFEGGRDIQLCDVSTTGLGTYDATKTDGTAYPKGVVNSKWRAYSLFMDRGVQFGLDHLAPSDSGFLATAENIMREFTRVNLVQEMDTYRICKLYNTVINGAYSDTNSLTGTITKDNAVAELLKTLNSAQNASEQIGGFVAYVNQDHLAAFMEATSTSSVPITFGNTVKVNDITYENVMKVGELPCIFVPKSRMVTEISILTGRDAQSAGGITKSDSGKYLNFMVLHTSTPLPVTKIESIKQIEPEDNQLFDGTLIQVRYLYDCFIPKNKVCSVAVHAEA